MFGKLKDKLKKSLSIFSKKAEEEVAEEPVEEEKQEKVVEEEPKLKKEYKEKLNILNEEGKIIGEETREKIHKEGLLHQEVHVLVFNDQKEILFQKRSPDQETFPNLLDSSAGGHVEIGEDYPSAAIKEAEEEIGLKINKEDLIFISDFKNKSHDTGKDKINYVLRKVYAYQLKKEEKLKKNKEVADLEFWPIEKVFDLKEGEKKRFIPTIISEKYFEFYKKIEDLPKTEEEKEEPKLVEEKTPEKEPKPTAPVEVKEEPKKGFFKKAQEFISTKKISENKFDNLFWDLELALLENNVAVEVIEKIKQDLKEELVDKPLPRNVEKKIEETLQKSLAEVLAVEKINLLEKVKSKKPFTIAFFGINGSGKTTSIAKVAHLLKKQGLTSVLAASDTFRAAAIHQLEEHAHKLDLKIIKHDYGSDAAAVAFDALQYAEKNKIDVVLIDTAGRLHSDTNLMDELKKIIRVVNPDLKIFVGESITGNDCVEQASRFNEHIGLDSLILTKADVDEKGGAAISVSFITKKPILFIGTGQEYDNLQEFNADLVLDSLGLK